MIIPLVSVLLSIQLQYSIAIVRKRKTHLRARFPNDLGHLFFGEKPGRVADFLDRYSVFALLVVVVIGGGILSIWTLSILSC